MVVRTVVAVVFIARLVAGEHVLVAQRHEQKETRKVGQTCTLRIEGMACGACENRVQKVAKRIDGVADIVADHRTNSARVTFDPSRTSPSAIAKAITENAGFKSAPKQ